MPRNSALLLVPVLVLALVALTAVGVREFRPASAGTPLLVTKTADTADGTCDADCSLREAIIAANSNLGADTITVPAGAYTLSIAGTGEDAAATGDLDITDDVTINGAGVGTTVIDADAIDRVFDADPAKSGVTVGISGVTVQGGNPGDAGGGIRNSGNLTLDSVTVTGNETDAFNRAGGGILNHNDGVLIVNNSTISDNHAKSGGGGSTGGGIQNANVADITINNTTIINNSATEGGGFHNSNGATATMNDSTVSGNTALSSNGGGISVTQGTEMTINNTTIESNTAASEGGGVNNVQSGILTIDSSIIRGNTADFGGGVQHAGSETIEIRNSTISGNNARESSGGLNNFGSGISELNNVTITGNTADSDSTGTGEAGGIGAVLGTVNLKNTIVAGNFDLAGDDNPDCFGTLTSASYNLIQDVSAGCAIAGDITGNITGQDPLLDPLANNGGPTPTHALVAGSPAIDAGNPANPGSGGDACEAADQRGIVRPLDGDADGTARCDIGAYEAPGDAPPSALWGDDDCDGDVDAVDALKNLQHVAALPFTQSDPCFPLGETVSVTPAGFGDIPWGDVDCDQDVDAVDALTILRSLAALPVNQQPNCPEIGSEVLVS